MYHPFRDAPNESVCLHEIINQSHGLGLNWVSESEIRVYLKLIIAGTLREGPERGTVPQSSRQQADRRQTSTDVSFYGRKASRRNKLQSGFAALTPFTISAVKTKLDNLSQAPHSFPTNMQSSMPPYPPELNISL